MKVILIGSYPPPYGGVSVHIQRLHHNLKQSGHKSVVINTWQSLTDDEDDDIITLRGGKVRRHLSLAYKALIYNQNCDIVHIHSATGSSFWAKALSIWLLKFFNKRCVLTIHAGDFAEFALEGNLLRKWLVKITLKCTKHIIAVNANQEKAMSKLGISGNQISVIGPFLPIIFTDKQNQMPLSVREFFNSHHPILSTVGAITSEYGLDLLVQSIVDLRRNYPDIGLVGLISTSSRRSLERELQAEIKKLNLENNILFLHNVPYALSVIKSSDVFVRPSYFDGDAICVREALFLAVPVVASKTDFRPEGVVLFRVGDAQDLFDKLMQVLDEPQKYRMLSTSQGGFKNLQKIVDAYKKTTGTLL